MRRAPPATRGGDAIEATHRRFKTRAPAAGAVLLAAVLATSCGTVTGAAVGAGTGAAVGAGTGYGAGKGALIGTGVGAAAGAIYDITKQRRD